MRRIGQQKEQSQGSFRGFHELSGQADIVERGAVDDDEDRMGRSAHQTLQQGFEDGGVHGALMTHESKCAFRPDRKDHVEGNAQLPNRYNRRLSDRCTACVCVVVRAQSRFIRQVNRHTHAACFRSGTRIGLRSPLMDKNRDRPSHRTGRLLSRETRQHHDPAHRDQGKGSTELTKNQLSDQRQHLQCTRLGCIFLHHSLNSGNFHAGDFGRPALPSPDLKARWSSLAAGRRAIQGSFGDAEGFGNFRDKRPPRTVLVALQPHGLRFKRSALETRTHLFILHVRHRSAI